MEGYSQPRWPYATTMRHGACPSRQLCVVHLVDDAAVGPAAAARSPRHMPASRARRPAALRQRVDQATDKRLVVPARELDAARLRRGSVCLCWPSRPRTAPAGPPLELDGHEARLGEPLEAPARDAPRDVQLLRD